MGRIASALRARYLRRPRPMVEVDVGGMRMRLAPDQYVDGWLLFAPQFFEADELDLIASVLRPGDVFVDVGAHIGMYALRAARAVGPTGSVVAIEPNPSSARELHHNLALNGLSNVRIVEAAAAGRPGRRVLALAVVTNRAGATLLGGEREAVEVAALPLERILVQHGVERVRAMKLDIEGAEHEVLSAFFASAPRTLWPAFVLTERHPALAERAGDALALLERNGYRLRMRSDPNYVLKLPTPDA